MTNSDAALQNSQFSFNLVAVSPNKGAGSQDGAAGFGIQRDPAEFNPCTVPAVYCVIVN